MEQFATLMLHVWQIASRHTEIALSTTDIAQILAQWMPLGQMLVRRIEPERACIETVGIAPQRSPARYLGDHSDCAPAHMQRLLAWCRRGEVIRWPHRGRTDQALAAAIPSGLQGELFVGPLVSEHESYGMELLDCCVSIPTHCVAKCANSQSIGSSSAVKTATQQEREAIILGRHETSGWKRHLADSVARRVIAQSPLPMLLVNRSLISFV